jgi:tripartite-type tricarboxylate transporter receptor subunit TctC
VRKTIVAIATVCILVVAGNSSLAEGSWPQRPVKIIVGVAAGGFPDIMARLVAKHLAESLGQPFIVENRPGAGGNIAAQAVVGAAADGHTLLLTGNNQAVNPTLLPNPGFDYERDLAPVAMIGETNMVLVASSSVRAGNALELIALAKTAPDTLSIAISPIGTPNHLGAELLNQMMGANLRLVPYSGISNALPDLLGDRVQLAVGAVSSVYPFVEKRQLKALALARSTRSPIFPNIPSATESGLPGFEVSGWVCLVAPGKTPETVIRIVNQRIVELTARADIVDTLAKQGIEPRPMSSDELRLFIKAEAVRWADVLKRAQEK